MNGIFLRFCSFPALMTQEAASVEPWGKGDLRLLIIAVPLVVIGAVIVRIGKKKKREEEEKDKNK